MSFATKVFLKSLSTLVFIVLFQDGFSQSTSNTKKNIIYTEVGGAFVAGVGLAYERYIFINPGMRSSVRAGLGAIDRFSKASYFGGGSFLFGKKSSVEIGINYLINYDASVFRELEVNEDKFRNGVQAIVGYRYQNWENGLTFRIFYVPPIGCCGSAIPIYGGASVGYAF